MRKIQADLKSHVSGVIQRGNSKIFYVQLCIIFRKEEEKKKLEKYKKIENEIQNFSVEIFFFASVSFKNDYFKRKQREFIKE